MMQFVFFCALISIIFIAVILFKTNIIEYSDFESTMLSANQINSKYICQLLFDFRIFLSEFALKIRILVPVQNE